MTERQAPTDDAAAPATEELSAGRLVLSTLATLLALVAVVAALGAWFHEPLMASGHWFVTHLGGPGIAVGFLIPDAFTVPIPNDAFLALGRAGEMPTIPLVAWAMLGSVAGGSLGWTLGRLFRRTRRLDRFMRGRGAKLDRALRRHGVAVVAIAAITPLPYSISAWAAGSTHMPYASFLAVSMLRIIRIVGSLWLIDLGLMSVT
ncbi:MAG: VTT domain-containing protein [Deltaproteobacteria bacterium]|nr:VTT domain-containing protein [Deltaproteobacteria bacterium]